MLIRRNAHTLDWEILWPDGYVTTHKTRRAAMRLAFA
jgi:hypothetical protein